MAKGKTRGSNTTNLSNDFYAARYNKRVTNSRSAVDKFAPARPLNVIRD
jgi:hypothetical protein